MSIQHQDLLQWRYGGCAPLPAVVRPVFAVLGGGHGGLAMAGDLASRGFAVHLYNKSPERIQAVQALGGILMEAPDRGRGFAPLRLATAQIAQAVAGADVIMVVVPATAHRALAALCAPHLVAGQKVLLNPGRTGGAIEFRHTLRRFGCQADVVVGEAQTFVYASRTVGPARARIFGRKLRVPLAAIPARRTGELLAAVGEAFPQFVAAPSVLKTSMDNMGAILHPGLTILNSARIESTRGDFDYYHDGLTPGVARVLEAMDAERCQVARALGVEPLTVRQWLLEAYGAAGGSLVEAIRNNAGYAGIKAPTSLDTRYICEDVPTSLVPMASLGDQLGVPTPTIKNVIQLAELIHAADYWGEGRTVAQLGLAGYGAEEIRHLALEGEVPQYA